MYVEDIQGSKLWYALAMDLNLKIDVLIRIAVHITNIWNKKKGDGKWKD